MMIRLFLRSKEVFYMQANGKYNKKGCLWDTLFLFLFIINSLFYCVHVSDKIKDLV